MNLRTTLTRIAKAIAPTLVLVGIIEVALRVTGVAPSGFFDFLTETADAGLYPANETIENRWGPIPYTVETTALGLRGTAVALDRRERRRILTIGDSLADGFFVDNDGTFQHFLQRLLEERNEGRYEVLNGARGGGSIDKELAILKRLANDLDPDIVVLTFVTNDIADLQGLSQSRLLNHRIQFHTQSTSPFRRLTMALFTKTAIGELMFRLYWNAAIKKQETPPLSSGNTMDQRYRIHGGSNYAENCALFNRMFSLTDGLVLHDDLSAGTQQLIDNYVLVFKEFVATCRARDIELFFVYFPSYTQIYDSTTSMRIRDILLQECNELEVPFLDLTPIFKQVGSNRVLHLAPVDFHPNPAGNALIARAIFDFFLKQNVLP